LATGWDGYLPGARRAGRVGGWIVVGVILALPGYLILSEANDLALVTPGSAAVENGRRIGRGLLLIVGCHWLLSVLRGGGWHFLHPFRNIGWLLAGLIRPAWYRDGVRSAANFTRGAGLMGTLSLGVRAYLGTMAWLIVPAWLMTWGPDYPLAGIVGGFLLAWATTYLPCLATRLAVENRMGVFLELRATRELRRRAPLAFALATTVWVLLAIPFHLLLVEKFPYGLLWLPAVGFVLTQLPGRWLAGWAMGRAMRRVDRAGWWVRWPAWWLAMAAGGLYALVTFFTPYTAYRGKWALFEHHAFLFPLLG
jgi:hypothetical protein